ncbi:MAG: hypothetical protein EA397_16860 [Deltaproteobacteria bacterium]|nr:MAG: hypothetical protein EA397_16860 [Deltaproteobacteria bacterium]
MTAAVQPPLDRLSLPFIQAIARMEHSGARPVRLTEPGRATWRQFKGNLDLPDLIALLAEDLAVTYPIPGDPSVVLGRAADGHRGFAAVPSTTIFDALQTLTSETLTGDRRTTLLGWARHLDVPARFAGADLRKIKATDRVVELPGTGGLLCARALETSDEAFLHTNCVVLTKDWSDRALAGLVAVEHRAPNTDFIWQDPELARATARDHRETFTLVFGLQPEKGGTFAEKDLQGRFPNAAIVLV